MNILLIIIALSAIFGSKIYIKGFHKDYLSKESTTCVNGIFMFFVFYRHISTYMIYQPTKDSLMMTLNHLIGQLIVTTFLFYSGYGIYESIKKRKKDYIKTIPKKRILKVFLQFAIAVISYAILNHFLGHGNNIKDILIALTGWESIGNSNWYILAILLLYLSTYISFSIIDDNNKKAILLNIIITILIMVCIGAFKGPENDYYYNTLLCYPLGMMYSYYKNKINKYFQINNKYIMITSVLLISTIALIKLMKKNIIFYSAASTVFVLLIVFITMKIRFNNRLLKFIGNNLFWIYILQRIPMIIFSKIGIAQTHAYRYFVVCVFATILLTIIYKYFFKMIAKKLKLE